MNDLEKAARLALEALEWSWGGEPIGSLEKRAIDALRAALAKADEDAKDAERYRWLKINGLQRAWVSIGTDTEGENFAEFKCEFRVPEPPNLPYEDEEGLQWSDDDIDAAIDAAREQEKK